MKVKSEKFIPDHQVSDTPSYYNDSMMKVIHEKLIPLMEKEVGIKLFPTYCYFRVYKHGDVLEKHKDRPSCEVSTTLFIGSRPDKIWSIFLKDKKENTIEVKLKPGDMLIYDGVHREHWRERFEGVLHVQVFLHYVDQEGEFAEHRDDKIERGLKESVLNM